MGEQLKTKKSKVFLVTVSLVTALLSVLAQGDGVFAVDVRVQRFVQRAPEPFFRWLADFGNWLGSAHVCAVFGAMAFIVFCLRRRPIEAVILVLAHAARLQNALLKSIFESPRPTSDLVRVDEIAAGWGFPSGHAMGATLCFGSIALVIALSVRSKRVIVSVTLCCVFIILLVGFGRIFVGAHWPTDVLGGYLYGLILLQLIYLFVHALRSRYFRPPRP